MTYNSIYLFKECGIHYTEPNVKIVGGQIATSKSWPSMAWINYKFTLFGQTLTLMCGGSLISRNVILTAAHCIAKSYSGYYIPPQPTYEAMLTVYLGVQDLNNLNMSPTIKRNVAKLFIVSCFI